MKTVIAIDYTDEEPVSWVVGTYNSEEEALDAIEREKKDFAEFMEGIAMESKIKYHVHEVS